MQEVATTPVFLSARWEHLVMLNYEVDPTILAPWVPRGTELDNHGGRHFVSMVGFRFLGTRVRGVAIPMHSSFEEVNLRFYVRRRVAGELRRGVVFIKEIVPRRAIAWVARALYGENYVALPMDHAVDLTDDGGGAYYRWKAHGRWCQLGATVHGPAALPDAGSDEAFIAEHYFGYSRQRDGATVEYRVQHPPWRVWRAQSATFECDVAQLYGQALAPLFRGRPSSQFLAEGSPVTVHRGVRV